MGHILAKRCHGIFRMFQISWAKWYKILSCAVWVNKLHPSVWRSEWYILHQDQPSKSCELIICLWKVLQFCFTPTVYKPSIRYRSLQLFMSKLHMHLMLYSLWSFLTGAELLLYMIHCVLIHFCFICSAYEIKHTWCKFDVYVASSVIQNWPINIASCRPSLNSLAPGWFDHSLKLINFKLISTINVLSIFCEPAIRWRPQHLINH